MSVRPNSDGSRVLIEIFFKSLAWIAVCCFAAAIAFTAFLFGLFVLKEPVRRQVRSGSILNLSSMGIVWTLLKKWDMILIVFIVFLSTFQSTTAETGLPLLLVREQQAPIWQVVAVFAVIAIMNPIVTGLLYVDFGSFSPSNSKFFLFYSLFPWPGTLV